MPLSHLIITAIAIIIAYLIGSLSSAVIVCKIAGLPDPRTQGSKNPGATNVLRFGGKKAAIITLLGDLLKGFIVVLVARLLGFVSLSIALIAFAVFLGHLYPVFFQFKGGKGVATAFGCILAISFPVAFLLIVTWLVIAIIFRYSSLAALIASIFSPLYMAYFTNSTYTILTCFISLFLIYRHRSNIRNLWQGKEAKIGEKKNIQGRQKAK